MVVTKSGMGTWRLEHETRGCGTRGCGTRGCGTQGHETQGQNSFNAGGLETVKNIVGSYGGLSW